MSVSQRIRRKGKVNLLGNNRNWENYRDILIVLLQKELKVRYNNKLLGYLWSIANPLAAAVVYFVAFQILMRLRVPDYQLILLTGVFPWQWFTNAVGSASNVFVGNASIIKKVNFPRNIVPLCMVTNHMIHFIMSIPVIVLFLLFYQRVPSLTWLYGIPLWLVVHFFMVYGIALGLASINLFFRDLERLMSIVLNFAFYLTPVLYPLDLIPEHVRHYMFLNPAAPLIAGWRELLLDGRVEWLFLAVSAGYAALFFAIGMVIYRRLSWKFAEVL
ncbi:ABC transporter permease [Leptolyngbya sp. NK1-12]|uniref:Transport permease protein n=1 Tax=Leptolyngbya sp. NK1-12 TaxID=2547451 RepID=A0AA96WFU4_9CYAN|nr:ABC transporter permease [Leptolyngbya sp. NK1-12]WNZ24403.1 ABC transporter permease [Leptolyngbya sp. NK1-12]